MFLASTIAACIGLTLPARCDGQPNTSQPTPARIQDTTQPPVVTRPAAAGTLQPRPQDEPAVSEQVFDGNAAFEVLVELCELGPRPTGSDAMAQQRRTLKRKFEAHGGEVQLQPFTMRHPVTGANVRGTNMIVRFFPEKENRILLCTHFDTRPFPNRDRRNPTGIFLGANDGASGCGFFVELARHLPQLDGHYGVDLVLFDAEEFVYQLPRDPLFVGSTHFANEYVAGRVRGNYVCGILLDMIADKHLDLYWEKNSFRHCPIVCRSVWATAQELGVREFKSKLRHEVRDDHLPLNMIARIPTIDIIDFDYPTISRKNAYWHTTQDTPENCSAESLEKVGRVIIAWLKKAQAQPPKE